MRAIYLALVLLAVCPLFAFAQQQDNNQTNPEQCSNCQEFYLVTGKNLWRVDQSGNLSLCASDFCNAKGVAVDSQGNIFVADEGENAIYRVAAQCGEKQLVVSNDGLQTSWLFPHDITIDSEDRLIVAMEKNDPLWSAYELPRRRLARGVHVYRLELDQNGNFSGRFDILAGGVNNGRDVFFVRFDRTTGTLWGTRNNRYVVRYIDNAWEDWLGPHNLFRLASPLLGGVRQVDAAFARCGYMAVAADVDRQFLECRAVGNVSLCDARCPELIDGRFSNDLRDDCISASSNNIVGDVVSVDLSQQQGNQSSSGGDQEQCEGLLVPYSVVIDCACNLIISDIGSRQLVVFPYQGQQSSNQSSGGSQALLGQASVLLGDMNETVIGMINYDNPNCESPVQPEPTQQPEPQPTQPTQPTQPPQTPQPTATARPEPTPIPTITNAPAPNPTSTVVPASAFRRRLGLIH